jgi:hypothetical protein
LILFYLVPFPGLAEGDIDQEWHKTYVRIFCEPVKQGFQTPCRVGTQVLFVFRGKKHRPPDLFKACTVFKKIHASKKGGQSVPIEQPPDESFLHRAV